MSEHKTKVKWSGVWKRSYIVKCSCGFEEKGISKFGDAKILEKYHKTEEESK